VYDEAIGDSIGEYILLAVKFYAYVHSGALDGFINQFEQSMTAKDLFSISESIVEQLIP